MNDPNQLQQKVDQLAGDLSAIKTVMGDVASHLKTLAKNQTEIKFLHDGLAKLGTQIERHGSQIHELNVNFAVNSKSLRFGEKLFWVVLPGLIFGASGVLIGRMSW